MAHTTVRQALQRVASGKISSEAPIEAPVHELVCMALFDIANHPDPKKPGTMRRATRAQKIILDRMVGKRLPGSNPAAQGGIAVSFVDLTKAVIGGETDAGDGADT